VTTISRDQIFTIPNVLSFARLLGVPYFFWLIVVPHSYGPAVIVLFVSGATDWLDGYLARRLSQFSRLGELLDPLADRLYILAALAALYIQDFIPVWVVLALLGRDLLMTAVLGQLKRRGITGLPVHFVGKAATMNLLYALPLILLGSFTNGAGHVAHIVGWAFLIWGVAMYWYAAVLYLQQVSSLKNGVNA